LQHPAAQSALAAHQHGAILIFTYRLRSGTGGRMRHYLIASRLPP
jgi:hypothetical protein